MRQTRYSGRQLAIAVVLAAVAAVAGWELVRDSASQAYAATPKVNQVLDAGVQRRQIVEEIAKTNKKVDALITLLKSGKVKVQVDETTAKKGG